MEKSFSKPSERLNCIIMPHKYPSVGFLNCPISVYRRPELNLKGRSEKLKTTPEGGKWGAKALLIWSGRIHRTVQLSCI